MPGAKKPLETILCKVFVWSARLSDVLSVKRGPSEKDIGIWGQVVKEIHRDANQIQRFKRELTRRIKESNKRRKNSFFHPNQESYEFDCYKLKEAHWREEFNGVKFKGMRYLVREQWIFKCKLSVKSFSISLLHFTQKLKGLRLRVL
jgi:hypothetical protein